MDYDFDWFLERLDVAKWERKTPGNRSCKTNCPVHGGSDSLHVTERVGKTALVKCFSGDCSYEDVRLALAEAQAHDSSSETEATPHSGALQAPQMTVRRRKRSTSTGASPVAQSASQGDPMDWYADYCQVDRAYLEALGIEGTSDGWVSHSWPGFDARKERQAGTAERRWRPKGHAPRLWPMPQAPMPPEIWLAEGETDVIALMQWGLDAYTSGSATQTLDEEEMKILRDLGVEKVVIAYDSDKEGRSATEKSIKAATDAGLQAVTASPGNPILGGYKDWRQRWITEGLAAGPPETSVLAIEQDVYTLDDPIFLEPIDKTLWLDRIHPHDHTVLYGDGSTGKGVLAAWWIARLTRANVHPGPFFRLDKSIATPDPVVTWPGSPLLDFDGNPSPKRVLIVDYEGHSTEWFERFENFGGRRDMVHIYQPDNEPIWNISGDIAGLARNLGVDIIFVDSATYAVAETGSKVEDSATAARYSNAVAQFHVPVVTLAHVTKSEDKAHAWPFGSIFWHNGARLTWNFYVDGDVVDDPHRLVNRKHNQGAPAGDIHIDWKWVHTGLPWTLSEVTAPVSSKGGGGGVPTVTFGVKKQIIEAIDTIIASGNLVDCDTVWDHIEQYGEDGKKPSEKTVRKEFKPVLDELAKKGRGVAEVTRGRYSVEPTKEEP